VRPPADAALAREAQLIARYLLDRDCPPEMVERYALAQEGRRKEEGGRRQEEGGRRQEEGGRRQEEGGRRGERVARFAFAHPWSIPFLDAAGAFLGDGALLRDKLLVMSAVLEASPRFADEFLPRQASRAATLARVAAYGVVAGAKALVGLPLMLLARVAG
jgi:hypothetical protein